MTFAQPIFLLAGLVAMAALVWAHIRAARRRRRDLERFAAAPLMARLTEGVSVGRRRAR